MFAKPIASLLAAAALIAGSAVARADDSRHQAELLSSASRIFAGFRISPVRVDLRGKNVLLVGLGSYLVNAATGCNDCHTYPSYAPGGDPFRGEPERVNVEQYLAGGRQFGPFTAPNITPDASGLPHGLTYEEFAALMRTGRDPENPDRILQVMPWPVYAKLTPLDLRAIYEYLRAIPARPDNPNPGP